MQINWDPNKMATGVPEVDAQHQEWIRRYNEFDAAVSHGQGLEAVQSALDFLPATLKLIFGSKNASWMNATARPPKRTGPAMTKCEVSWRASSRM